MRGGWNGEDCPICVEKMLDESKYINVHVHGSKNRNKDHIIFIKMYK